MLSLEELCSGEAGPEPAPQLAAQSAAPPRFAPTAPAPAKGGSNVPALALGAGAVAVALAAGLWLGHSRSGGRARIHAPAALAAAPAGPFQSPSAAFVIPDSSNRRLGPADLAGLSPGQLKIARNEIFARHGRIFLGPALQEYFSRQPWYSPRQGAVRLTPLEASNVALIRQAEGSTGDTQP
jgi:hypothetical protein